MAYPRVWGRAQLGAIAGAEMMVLVIGSAIGPVVLASSKDAFASYVPALHLFLVLPALAIVAALAMRHPQPLTPGDAKGGEAG